MAKRYVFSASKEPVTMNTVLLDTVYSAGSAGIVLKGFIGKTNRSGLAFETSFRRVSDLIVDLRYNTGYWWMQPYLSDLMAGYTANNQILELMSTTRNNRS